MATDVRYISPSDFLVFTSSGDLDLPASMENLQVLLQYWKTNPKLNVLVDLRKARANLKPREVYEFYRLSETTRLGDQNRVAILYTPPEGFDAVRFLEFLAKRGKRNVQVCEDFEEAFDWLNPQVEIALAQGQ